MEEWIWRWEQRRDGGRNWEERRGGELCPRCKLNKKIYFFKILISGEDIQHVKFRQQIKLSVGLFFERKSVHGKTA